MCSERQIGITQIHPSIMQFWRWFSLRRTIIVIGIARTKSPHESAQRLFQETTCAYHTVLLMSSMLLIKSQLRDRRPDPWCGRRECHGRSPRCRLWRSTCRSTSWINWSRRFRFRRRQRSYHLPDPMRRRCLSMSPRKDGRSPPPRRTRTMHSVRYCFPARSD